MMVALLALVAPATAGAAPHAHAAKKKVKAPVVTSVSPLDVAVGETLTIRGRNFISGRGKNTVVFKRDGARAVFAKAEIGTKKMLSLKVPASLQEFFGLSKRRAAADAVPHPRAVAPLRQEVHEGQALPDRARAAPAPGGRADRGPP